MAISQVVAMKVDGTLYNTLPPNATGSGAGGNGGSAAKVTSTSLMDGVLVSRYDAGVFGSTVINNNDTEAALLGGTFAYNNPGPISKRVTKQINGSDQDILLSGAAVPSLIESIHYIRVCGEGCLDGIKTRRLTSAIRAGKFNEFTGEFEAGYPVVADDFFSGDDAAKPSRDVPGELTYKSSSLVPVNDNYKAKTG